MIFLNISKGMIINMTNENICVILFSLAIGLWVFTLIFLDKKRDEREYQALLKALLFTVTNTVFIGILGVIKLIEIQTFTIPIWYVFTLMILGFILMPLMYRIYLLKENLEPAFIANWDTERKATFYSRITSITSFLLIVYVAYSMYEVIIVKSMNPYQNMALVVWLFTYFLRIVNSNAPRKKLDKQSMTQRWKKYYISVAIYLILGLAFGIGVHYFHFF